MPRKKKSRKVGQIGTPKTSTNVRKPTEKRLKKPKGKPAGSRNSESVISTSTGSSNVKKDPRHGSKKPIELIVVNNGNKVTNKTKIRHFSPSQELAEIEQDIRFTTLLENQDIGKTLNREEQRYVVEKLARHKILCELLGLTEEDSIKPEETEIISSGYEGLDALNIEDFKD